MKKLVLFLLKPGFYDKNDGPFFCPDCATVEGFLHYVPDVGKKLDIRRVDFKKPRNEIIQLLGESHQGCPVLILDDVQDPIGATKSTETGKAYLTGGVQICDFLGRTFGVMRPHP